MNSFQMTGVSSPGRTRFTGVCGGIGDHMMHTHTHHGAITVPFGFWGHSHPEISSVTWGLGILKEIKTKPLMHRGMNFSAACSSTTGCILTGQCSHTDGPLWYPSSNHGTPTKEGVVFQMPSCSQGIPKSLFFPPMLALGRWWAAKALEGLNAETTLALAPTLGFSTSGPGCLTLGPSPEKKERSSGRELQKPLP